MSVNWNAIREEWETTGITLIDLAEKHGVKEGTLKSRKSREKWEKVATKKDASKNKKMQPSKKVASSNPPKKRSGNPNPENQFTKRNDAAVTHGFYAKYLPQTLKDIVDDAKSLTIVDRLYFQIESKFAALVHLHKIMFVEDRGDTLSERQEVSVGKNSSGESYKISYAYEQYAEYVKTEARLTSEWRNVVKQFLELAGEDDERRLKLEQMQTNIDKNKAEIEKISNGDTEGPLEIRIIPKSKE